MTRDAWLNLNGLCDYAIVRKDADRPTESKARSSCPFPFNRHSPAS